MFTQLELAQMICENAIVKMTDSIGAVQIFKCYVSACCCLMKALDLELAQLICENALVHNVQTPGR